MATSGSTDFNLTRDEIITEALERIGILASGETANSDDVTSCARSLNILVKSLHADPFIDFRFLEEKTLSLSDGTASYSLASGTKSVTDVWLRIDSVDYHLDVVSRETYNLISNKTAEGQPYQVFVDGETIYCYPTPGESYTLHYVREGLVEDFDASTDNADYPVDALEMLVCGLCSLISNKFQLPPQERMYFDQKFELEKRTYRAGRTNRHGRELIRPNFVV